MRSTVAFVLGLSVTGCGSAPPPPPPPPPAPEPVPPAEPEPDPIVLTSEMLAGLWINESQSEWPSLFFELVPLPEGDSLRVTRICDGPPDYGSCRTCGAGEVETVEASIRLRCEAGEEAVGDSEPLAATYDVEAETIEMSTGETLGRTDELGLEYWRDFRDFRLSGREFDPEPTRLIYDVAREAATRVFPDPAYRQLRFALDHTFRTYSRRFRCRIQRRGQWAGRRETTPCEDHRAEVVEAVIERLRRRFPDE